MSLWTHMSGTLRLDSLKFEKEDTMNKSDFNKIFIVSTWEKWNRKCNVPCGSEGSIEYSLWINPNISQVPSYQLSFRGDLRDFSDTQAILDWWKSIPELLKKLPKHVWIREGIMECSNYLDDYPVICGFDGDLCYQVKDGKYEVIDNGSKSDK